MAFGQEAVEQLWKELVRGYNLNAKLLELLMHPLDIRGQEEAAAMSQELSRVFMVSLFTLKPGDNSRVVEVRSAELEATNTEGSISQRSPAKNRRICSSGEEVDPHRKSRGNEVTKKELTASPHKDGYRWKKYGQKNIRNREFARFYYSCRHSHELGCKAKKQVQQQDNTSGAHRPMYQVTYVNEHTCHRERPGHSISGATNLPATDATTMTRNGTHFDPAVHVGDNAGLQSTLPTVAGGAPSTPPPMDVINQLSDPASYVPPPLLEVIMGLEEYDTTMVEMGVSSWCTAFPFRPVEASAAPSSSSLSPPLPVEASWIYLDGGGNIPTMDAMTMEEMYSSCGPLFSPVAAQSIGHWDDESMADAAGQYTDTGSAWPQ